ncbi:MAG: TniQ family protein [Anaerolineales bacterium]|nr:TniQ family protein [Anaerolineales bacterium]
MPSLLVRLARLNHYDPPGLLEHACLAGERGQGQASRPGQPKTFAQIATLTGIDPTTLCAATAHRFAPLLTPPDQSLNWLAPAGSHPLPCLGRDKRLQHLHPESAAQFCPNCLRAAAYHHLAWLPKVISVCLHHKCFLVEQCPQCRAPVTIRAMVETRCHQCQADLRRAPSTPLGRGARALLAQRVIQAWLMGSPLPDPHGTHLPPDQPPTVLYHLLAGLVFSLREPPRSTPDQHYGVLASVPTSLLNWPHGFHAFLDEYGYRRNRGNKREWFVDLDVLYVEGYEKQWQHPAFHFAREAFEEYLVKRYTASAHPAPPRWYGGQLVKAERFAYTTILEAAQQLHTSPEMVQRLAQLGYLVCFGPRGFFQRDGPFVRRSALWSLRRTWPKPLSPARAAWWLGTSVGTVLGLMKAGLLIAERDPHPNHEAQGQISKQSLVDLWSTVMCQAHHVRDSLPELIDLRRAAQRLETVGLKAADLISRVVAGALQVYRRLPGDTGLEALLFTEQDIQACAQVRKVKSRGDYSARKS